MYLLDTNVVSELRKIASRGADPAVAAWALTQRVKTFHLSVITILEVELGILRIERHDPIQGQLLRHWQRRQLLRRFEGRILPVTADIATRCAALHVPNPRPRHDALIAATALVHDMTVVTRNTADFAPMGVRFINPWIVQTGSTSP